MAAIRPAVHLYQEYATLSSTPATPELNVLIVGPAYIIRDYPDDRVNTFAGVLGTRDTAATGIASVAAADFTVNGPPNSPGSAVLDPSSVKVYLEDVVVEVASAADVVISSATPTKLTSAAVDFKATGVAAGDRVVLTGPTKTTTHTVRTVVANTLTCADELDPEATSARIERVLPTTRVSGDNVSTAGNSITVAGDFSVDGHQVIAADVFIAYRALRQDLQELRTIDNIDGLKAVLGWNVKPTATDERRHDGIDARNPLAVGASVALANTNTPIQILGVASDDLAGYVAARDSIGSRQDVYAVVPLSQDTAVIAAFKTEFEGLADVDTAIREGTQQKFRVVIGSAGELPSFGIVSDLTLHQVGGDDADPTPTGSVVAPEGVSDEMHTFSMTAGDDAAPDFVALGITPGDELTVDGTKYNVTRVVAESVIEVAEDVSDVGGAAGVRASLDMSTLSGDLADTAIVIEAIEPGVAGNEISVWLRSMESMDVDPVTISYSDEVQVYTIYAFNETATIGDVVDAIEALEGAEARIRVKTHGSRDVLVGYPGVLEVTPLAGGAEGVDPAPVTVTVKGYEGNVAVEATFDKLLHTEFYDANAKFIEINGVQPGHFLEIPLNPGIYGFGATKKFEIEAVLSNQRLKVRATNSLPYGYSEVRGSDGALVKIPTDAVPYRIVKSLDRDGQVQELISIVQSFKSRRVVMCWPDLVNVTDLTDGSLPRSVETPTVPSAALPQPGYYLACAVGGLTAALPSHQGFTFLGIAGISVLHHSNTYFTDRQITQLSNNGWFLFQQDSAEALPYVVHQLTTDPSTLQFGEYSMVKNFDFVSMFFTDILDDYIGIWNINPDTFGYIGTALRAGIESLKLRRRVRIGSPIIDGAIASLGPSTESESRIECYLEVSFPAPLNNVGLHIVSK